MSKQRDELTQAYLDARFVHADVEDTVRPAHVLRRALEEVAHLTTRMVIPEDGDVRGWEQVTVRRIGQIERVVKTALKEAHDD